MSNGMSVEEHAHQFVNRMLDIPWTILKEYALIYGIDYDDLYREVKIYAEKASKAVNDAS